MERRNVVMYDPVTARTTEVYKPSRYHGELIDDGWYEAPTVTRENVADLPWHEDLHYHGPNSKGLPNPMCHSERGPRGGLKTHQIRVRVAGSLKTWKTRPKEFSLPVKYGLKEWAHITHDNGMYWHRSSECPELVIERGVRDAATVR